MDGLVDQRPAPGGQPLASRRSVTWAIGTQRPERPTSSQTDGMEESVNTAGEARGLTAEFAWSPTTFWWSTTTGPGEQPGGCTIIGRETAPLARGVPVTKRERQRNEAPNSRAARIEQSPHMTSPRATSVLQFSLTANPRTHNVLGVNDHGHGEQAGGCTFIGHRASGARSARHEARASSLRSAQFAGLRGLSRAHNTSAAATSVLLWPWASARPRATLHADGPCSPTARAGNARSTAVGAARRAPPRCAGRISTSTAVTARPGVARDAGG